MVLIQKKTILMIFLMVFIVEGLLVLKVFQVIPYERLLARIMPDLLIDLTNKERSSLDLGYLLVNPALQEAASLKAKDMAKKGYFDHTSPDGISPWHWFEEVGYKFSFAGENLAVNFIDSNVLHQAWLDSPSHRNNILNENFTEIGIGTAEGFYKGRNAVFVVQLFGRPRISVLPEEDYYQEPGRVVETERDPALDVLGFEQEAPFQEDLEEKKPELEVVEKGDSFIVVKSLEEDLPDDVFLGTRQERVKYSSLMARILSSPKTMVNTFLMSLGILFLFFGAFAMIRRPRISIYSLAVNGIIIFFIIGGSVWINHWIFSLFGFVS